MKLNMNHLAKGLRIVIKNNGPLISSAAAGIGVGVTAYLAGKASFQAADLIHEDEFTGGTNPDPRQRLKERTQLVWKLYIPTAVSGATTVLCIVAGHRLAANKTLAAQAALAISERAYSEYRDKVVEHVENGADKDRTWRQQIADGRARELVTANPPPKDAEIRAELPGDVLCHEAYTGRYFLSSKQKIHDAMNKVNSKVFKFEYATLDDFYHEVGLRYTSTSGEMGWNTNRPMDLLWSTVMSEDGRPCLSFEYASISTIP